MYSCVAVSEYLLTNQLWFNTYTMPETDPVHEDDKGLARKSWADSFLQPEKKRTSWADHFLRPGMDLESVSFFILGTHANDKSCSPHVLVCVIDYDDVCASKICRSHSSCSTTFMATTEPSSHGCTTKPLANGVFPRKFLVEIQSSTGWYKYRGPGVQNSHDEEYSCCSRNG